ncbi:uncharacterized protein [Gossypium hirsutum]|uniref:Uncharacterized protein n=1 Tax=Gossypium hirsutum TaxID=3635 RepID=A0ABM3AW84_GOSHI|nr:uncharacterized protein LOC121222428 [Gossypium hirsutum]
MSIPNPDSLSLLAAMDLTTCQKQRPHHIQQGFLSGNEEFETGSENDRPLDGNPDKGIELGGENNGGVSERYKIYVANKDDDDLDSLENSMANEEESGGVDVPVAQVSMDDEVLFSQLSTKTFSLEVESK